MLLQVQHPANDTVQLFGVPRGNPLELAFLDLHGKGHRVLGLERRVQGTQLIDYAPKRPNVALLVVLLIVNLLRRHVVRGANVRECELGLVVEHARQAEVAELHIAVEI